MNLLYKYPLIFSILIFAIILTTNSYFNYEQSLIYGGTDGISYLEIARKAPFLSDTPLKPIHAERFLFPYLIGILSKISSINLYDLFRILNILIILIINFYLIKILKKYNFSNFYLIFALLLFNLNPYQTRFYVANPLIITDLFFILGSIVSITGIDDRNKRNFFIGLIISSLARQSAVAIIISVVVVKLFKKEKFFLSYKEIFISWILFISIYLIGFIYSKLGFVNVSHTSIYIVHFFGLLLEDVTLKEKIIFFIWPLLSFGPLILFYVLFVNLNFKFIENNFDTSIYIIIYSLLIISQPIISGVEMSGRNIIRLSSFAFVPILLFSIINFDFKKNSIIKNIFFILLIIIWTCHPTFSKFNFLEVLKF